MKNLNLALNLKSNINDMAVKRIIIDYCYAFKKEYITNYIKKTSDQEVTKFDDVQKKGNEKFINKYYVNLIENTKKLKYIMKRPIQRNIYFEAYELRKELYNLLEPDIVMLNSNPLKNISNCIYYPNNQYYIK